MAAEPLDVLSGVDIRVARARYKLNQGELATETGVHIQTIVNIENDQVELTQEAYHRLLDAIERIATRKAEESSEQSK